MKHWSSTQQSISLSSGEAEFAGVIRGAGHGLGYQAMLRDLGVDVPLRVWTDSSAAVGICTRQGLAKLRHLDTHTLWIQQAVRTQRVDLRKVDGEQNPADLLTKHSISRQRLEDLTRLYGCTFLEGRAASAPQVRKGKSDKVTMAQADSVIGSATHDGEPQEEDVGSTAIMPHLIHHDDVLNELYPTLAVPADEDMEDAHGDEGDPVFQHGLRIAARIQYETETQGRRRRPNQEEQGGEVGNLGADETGPRTARGERRRQRRAVSHRPHRVAGQQQPPACGVALLGRKPTDSPSGLRRSEKKGYPQPPPLTTTTTAAAAATTATTTTTTPTRTCSVLTLDPRALRARAPQGFLAGTWLAQEQVP